MSDLSFFHGCGAFGCLMRHVPFLNKLISSKPDMLSVLNKDVWGLWLGEELL